MRRNWSLRVVSLLFLFAFAILVPVACAQDRPDIFLTPVPNAPFSAVVAIQRSVIRPDAEVSQFSTMREIGRDSQGRIHNERRALVPTNSPSGPPTRTSALLFPRKKTNWTATANHPTATVPPNM